MVLVLNLGFADRPEIAPVVRILAYAEVDLDVRLQVLEVIHRQALRQTVTDQSADH
jgi:hypothetical protein